MLAGTAILPSSAQAACYTGPYPANVTGANTCISVTGTSFTGNLVNSGTVTPGGISVATSTITGEIINAASGTITAGTGIALQTDAVVTGGIVNSGAISGSGQGIGLAFGGAGVGTFGGGIHNSGTISGANEGIFTGFTEFSGGISNSGTITSSAGDGLYVYGSSIFSGGINNAGTITAANIGIRIGGTTGFGAISTFTGGIVNSGTILATGTAAAISISGVSVFAGTISNTGTISGPTGISVSASGPVSVFDSGVITGTSGTAVDLSTNNPGNSFTLGPGYAITGNVLGAGADTFQLGGSGNGTFDLATFGTQYTGFTTFNVTSATWTATGTYAQTTPVTVQGGTLLVNGDLSQASNLLVTGGTLGGTGTVGNTQINSGGTFAPGAPGSAGTATTVSGSLAFQSGALYAVQVNPATASLAQVSGTATLAGTVQANFASAPGSYVAKQYTILTATGGLGGTTFAGLTNVNLPQGTADHLSYDGNDVYLNLTPGFAQYTGLNRNQQAVATALTNFFNSNGGIPGQFFGLTPGGLTRIDGEAATGAEQAAFQLTTEFLNLMLDPFVDGRSGTGGTAGQAIGFSADTQAALPPDVALAYASVLKAPPKASFVQRWTAWGGAYGGGSSISGDPTAGSNSLTAQTYGIAGGMDYHVSPDSILGFALAGGGTNWDLAGGLGGGRSDAFQLGGYGVTHAGPAYVEGAASFTNHWFSTSRTALGDQLTGRFQGQSYGARLEGGYRFAPLPWFGITPYAALQAQEFSTAAYSETDVTAGGFGLSFASRQASDVRSELGVRLDDPTMLGGMPLILRGRLAYAHDSVGNPSLSATFQTLPGASFIVNGAPIPKDSALTSVGAQLFITSKWSLLAKFDGEFAAGGQSYAGSGTLRYTW